MDPDYGGIVVLGSYNRDVNVTTFMLHARDHIPVNVCLSVLFYLISFIQHQSSDDHLMVPCDFAKLHVWSNIALLRDP